jgi:hypothetical protein
MGKIAKDAHEKAMASQSLFTHLPLIMLNWDQTFEDGMHGMLPIPVPGMSFFLRKIATWRQPGWWKYVGRFRCNWLGTEMLTAS